MDAILLLTRDDDLARSARRAGWRQDVDLHVVEEPARFSEALSLQPTRIFVDLEVGKAESVLACVREARRRAPVALLVAFLSHRHGDLPIRAKLAGADRITPRSQALRALAVDAPPQPPAG